MYERTLQSAVRYLATIPRHTVPMRELWTAVSREARASKIEECALPDFAALLEADTRFTILDNLFDLDDMDLDGYDEERREMIDLGFSPTCLVTLRLELEGEDGEEMPSIVHKHLSETKPSKVVQARSDNGHSDRTPRVKRSSSATVPPKKQSARRRRS